MPKKCVCIYALPIMNTSVVDSRGLVQEFKKDLDATNRSLKKAQSDLSEAQLALAAVTGERDELKRKSSALASAETELAALRVKAEEFGRMSAEFAALQTQNLELDKLYRDEQVLRKRYWNMLEDMKGWRTIGESACKKFRYF